MNWKVGAAITIMAIGLMLQAVAASIKYTAKTIANECIEAGETRINDTFFSCEPVGSVVNGKRIAFKKAYRSELNE